MCNLLDTPGEKSDLLYASPHILLGLVGKITRDYRTLFDVWLVNITRAQLCSI